MKINKLCLHILQTFEFQGFKATQLNFCLSNQKGKKEKQILYNFKLSCWRRKNAHFTQLWLPSSSRLIFESCHIITKETSNIRPRVKACKRVKPHYNDPNIVFLVEDFFNFPNPTCSSTQPPRARLQ